ncbi:MAG: glycerate kinase [Ruminococcus sp.]|nr:glycerate kinase [Ruminococcus sp.]
MSKRKLHKIVVAFDSFKGSISAREANECCADAIHQIIPDCEVVQIPIADGGEGFDIIAEHNRDYKKIILTVDNPLREKISARYFYNLKNQTAIIEMAQACGLTLLTADRLNPNKTSSYGLGQMIIDAVERGARNIVVGIGGTATNDGGMGMLEALGFRFLNSKEEVLEATGENLLSVHSINSSFVNKKLSDVTFTIACDVTNPLLGENGATYVYGPQKGGNKETLELLERGMENFANVLCELNFSLCSKQLYSDKSTAVDFINYPGAGAAGGVGAAFLWLGNATLKHGIDIVLALQKFNAVIVDADLIITGEGSIDNQTLNGKAISGIISSAQSKNISVIAIGGKVELSNNLSELHNVATLSIINKPSTLYECTNKNIALKNLHYTIRQIMILSDIFSK